MTSLSKITYRGKAIYLAYDQGMEHGPSHDFNDKNVDPLNIIEIARKGRYQGIILHHGIAEKYIKEIKKSKVPLIIKLNGKTKIFKGEPMSTQLCTVEEAAKLGAAAVGYTIHIGSAHEAKMLDEFAEIQKNANKKGIPVIAWVYPRGKAIKKPKSRENMAYSTRVALEIGAEMVKIKSNAKLSDLKWAVKSAGRCKVLVSGGAKASEKELLNHVRDSMRAGCTGWAIGRNVWQHKNPMEITKKLKRAIWLGK